MIKKLFAAATFAASMLVGVSTAHAGSPAMCYAEYNANMANCSSTGQGGSSTPCSQHASIMLQDCLQSLVTVES